MKKWLDRNGLFAAMCAAAAVLLVAAYSNHFGNSFHFDDAHVIQENLHIRDLGNAGRFFTDARTYSSLPANAAYRPITTLSAAIDYRLGGGLDVGSFHRTQFALLLVLAGLLVYFFRRLADLGATAPANRYLALFAAAFFSIHTANTETINYISSRSSLLSTLMVVASFVVYLAWPNGRRTYLYLVPLVIGALAKPLTVMFAPLFFAFVLMFEEEFDLADLRSRTGRQPLTAALRRTWPAFATAGLLFALVRWMEPDTLQYATIGRWQYLATQPYVWLHYVRLFLFPVGLTADTDLSVFRHWYDTRLFAGALFLCALGASIYWLQRSKRFRPAAFGLIWFALALLPTSSIFPLSEAYNEHRVFFPFVGLSFAAVWLGADLLERVTARLQQPRSRRLTTAGVALAIFAVHGVGTFQRNRVWATPESLWKDVTEKSPLNGRGRMNYGLALMRRGDFQGALANFERARELLPNYAYVYTNLAIAHSNLGRDDLAEQNFTRAIEILPEFAQGRYFFARWLIERSRSPEALQQLQQSLAISPSARATRDLFTRLMAALGDEETLAAVVQRTLAMDPSNPLALAYSEGRLPFVIIGGEGGDDDGHGHGDPGDAEPSVAVYHDLGLQKISEENWLDAAAIYQRAIVLDESSAVSWNNLGWALGKLGFYRLAGPCFERALALDPTMAVAKANLDWVLTFVG